MLCSTATDPDNRASAWFDRRVPAETGWSGPDKTAAPSR